MKRFLQSIVTPYGIVIFTIFFSFIMWVFPNFDGSIRKGFSQYYNFSYIGMLVCFLWFAGIVFVSFIGFKIGSSIRIDTTLADNRASINSLRPYFLISLLSYVGIMTVIARLVSTLGFEGIVRAVLGGQANTLKDTLYDSYSVGVVSLRYLAIPACALALYNLFHKRYILLNIFNIFALLLVALISSRLSIIFTIFTFIPLISYNRRFRIKPLYVLIFLVVLFHLLAALNYSRNILFYRSIGIDNFYLAGFSEIVTYLGSPFQGFLAAGTLGDTLVAASDIDTSFLTGISFELSTNSAFLELVRGSGVLQAFLIVLFSTLSGSIIMGLALRNRNNIFSLLFGSIGYCFAELWRVFLFGQGIVYTITIMIVVIALWCIFIPVIKPYSLKSRRVI